VCHCHLMCAQAHMNSRQVPSHPHKDGIKILRLP
jgi:hypothetical protein